MRHISDSYGWTLADGRWDAARMSGLLGRELDVVVAGTVDNQGDFYDCFDHVVLLSAPLDILIERVSSRTTNPYGRTRPGRMRRTFLSMQVEDVPSWVQVDSVTAAVRKYRWRGRSSLLGVSVSASTSMPVARNASLDSQRE